MARSVQISKSRTSCVLIDFSFTVYNTTTYYRECLFYTVLWKLVGSMKQLERLDGH